MIESKTKTFRNAEDKEVIATLNQLDGVKSTKLFLRMSRKLLPALARARSSGEQDRFQMFASVAETLTPEEFNEILSELLKGKLVLAIPSEERVESDGFSKLGEVFHADPFSVLEVAYFAVMANFERFFDRLKALKKPE